MSGFYNGWPGDRDLGVPMPNDPVIAEGVLVFENYLATAEGGDSGIDSSDNEDIELVGMDLHYQNDESDSSSSSSDSSEEVEVKKPMLKPPRKPSTLSDSMNTTVRKLDDDRQSPPLLEVELTASDDDDDASVLELVIPIPKKYQKVPSVNRWAFKKFLVCLCCCKFK